jgi:hypothetical protein
MKRYTILIIMFFSVLGYSQTIDYSQRWLNKLETPKYESDKLKNENLKSDYNEYDFSTLLIPRKEFLGYIGSDYKRIRIYYTSISRDETEKDQYTVKGISVVGDNKCDFEGTITLKQIREYINMHYGVDLIHKDDGMKSQGVLIGEYEFKENPNQKYTGTFQGVMTMYWFVDRYGIIHYDEIQWHSDNYVNNQYVGTWKSYSSGTEKTCNWGEHRIPFSGDLDIGAVFFSVNPKYKDKGWD